ncbi:hypothetical protein E6O75_ATG06545 [Venturia nashicola]|uniref:Uncharacterized protein n=1 Tax=Venturia nashicola TaxID=86259 RepID=A0A4Z1NUA0_9PEZI|nr:hypothetical protein E6O75_ATG06545 [Venturia nashicola]
MADRATDVVVAGEVMELMHDRAEDEEEQGWDGRILEDLGWRGSMGSREQTDLEKGEVDVEDGRGEEREGGEDGDRESSQHSPRLQDRKLEDQGADAADEKGDRRKNDAAVEKDDRREDGEERQSEIERQSNPDSRERSPCAWDRTSDDRESMPQRDSGDRERSPRPWDLSPEDREDSFSVLATNDDLRAQEEDQERMQRKKGRRERSRQRSEKERLKRRSLSPRRGSRSPRRSRERSAVRREKDHSIGSGHQIEDSWNISHVEHIAIDRGLLICGIAIGSEITNLDHETHIVGVDLHFFNVEVKEMAVKLGLIEIARFHGSVEGTLQSLNKGADRAHRIGVKNEKEHRLNRKLEKSSLKAYGRDNSDEDFEERQIPKTIPKTEAETDGLEREGRRSAIEKRKPSPSRDLSPYSKRRQLTHPLRPGVEGDVRSEDGARPPRRERNGGEAQSERGERGQHRRRSRYDHWTPDERPRCDIRSTRDDPHPREPYDNEREDSGSHEQTPDPRFRDFREEREERARQRNLKHGHHRGGDHRDSRGHGNREDRQDSRGYGGHEHRRDSRDHGGRDVIPQHQHHHRDSHHRDYNHQPPSHPENHRTTYPSGNAIPYPAWGHQHPPLPPPRYHINDHIRLRTPMTQSEKDYYQPTPGKTRYHKLWDKERPLRSGLYRVVERRYQEADLGVLWEYKVKAVKETRERKGESHEEREKRVWEDGRLDGVWFGENEVVDWEG